MKLHYCLIFLGNIITNEVHESETIESSNINENNIPINNSSSNKILHQDEEKANTSSNIFIIVIDKKSFWKKNIFNQMTIIYHLFLKLLICIFIFMKDNFKLINDNWKKKGLLLGLLFLCDLIFKIYFRNEFHNFLTYNFIKYIFIGNFFIIFKLAVYITSLWYLKFLYIILLDVILALISILIVHQGQRSISIDSNLLTIRQKNILEQSTIQLMKDKKIKLELKKLMKENDKLLGIKDLRDNFNNDI